MIKLLQMLLEDIRREPVIAVAGIAVALVPIVLLIAAIYFTAREGGVFGD